VAVSPVRDIPNQLWQYFPIVERTNTNEIYSVDVAVQAEKNIVLSGLNSSKRNVLTIYNPNTKQETIVMDGSNEVEIYSMFYSQKKKAIMFSGLRFSDNKYVLGEVSLG
jgi:Pyruvate/2-oxoacid:ferredoxin oxidoreductase gamma subunit